MRSVISQIFAWLLFASTAAAQCIPAGGAPPWAPGQCLNASQLNAAFNGRATSPIDAHTCGAVCDGSTDDTAALQSCINQFHSISLPGVCHTTGTLSIGNGSSSAGSSVNGVFLIGIGPNSGISYSGTGAAISVLGPWSVSPVVGAVYWGLSNFTITCSTSINSTIGLNTISAAWGSNINLSILGCFKGLNETTVSTAPPGFTNFDNLGSNWYNLAVFLPSISGATGITLTNAGVGTAANTDYNDFFNTTVQGPAGSTCLRLVATDSDVFSGLHCVTAAGVVFDYTIYAGWPASVLLDSVDAPTFTNNGSASAAPNYLNNVVKTNGNTYPAPPLANLQTDHGPLATSCAGLQTGAVYNNSGSVALCP